MRNKIPYLALVGFLVFALQAPSVFALSMTDISGGANNNSDSGNGAGLSMPGNGTSQTGVYAYQSGTLLNDGGTVYLIRGTQKIPFATAAAFTGLGYSFANVISGDSSNYALNGYIIKTASAEHPWGSWLSYQGTVYYLTSQGMVGVPSSDIFTANGGSWSMVLPANKYDIALLKAAPNLPVLTASDQRVYTTPTLSFSGGNPASNNPVTYNFSGNSSSTASSQPLVVTAPTAGAQFVANSLYSITWTGGSSGDFIKIDLVYQGSCNSGFNSTSTCGSILNIAASVPNAGSYLWLVPLQMVSAVTGYQIKITDFSQSISPAVSPVFYIVNTSTAFSNPTASATLPTVLLNAAGSTLAVGTQIIGKLVVVAPSSTSVTLTGVPLMVTTTGGVVVNGVSFIDDATSQVVSTSNSPFTVPAASNAMTTVVVNNDNIVPPGGTKTYDIAVPVTGSLGNSGTSSIALQLNGQLTFYINLAPYSVSNPTNQVTVSN